jgi:hypothetical protein
MARGRIRDRWRERGVLGALAVIVPELHATELADISADIAGGVPYPVVDNFLQEHVAERAAQCAHALGTCASQQVAAAQPVDGALSAAQRVAAGGGQAQLDREAR